MQRKIDRLTQRWVDRLVKEVDRAMEAGEAIKSRREADGNGLYVQIPEVSYTSLFRFQGTRHEAGLGSARIVGLNDARASNAEIRRKRVATRVFGPPHTPPVLAPDVNLRVGRTWLAPALDDEIKACLASIRCV